MLMVRLPGAEKLEEEPRGNDDRGGVHGAADDTGV